MKQRNCDTCKHNGVLSLDCGRCDDECSQYEPKQRTGQWIERCDGIGRWWECSQCGAHGGEGMKYCMFCGAKMQEVEG